MPGTRLFFLVSLLLVMGMIPAVLMGIAVREATNEQPADAAAGFGVWRANGCEGCHTLFGQGGPYAPDLTRIYGQRGEGYLRDFLVNPDAFYPDQRFMPRYALTVVETDSLLAFLDWVGRLDKGWPPREIQVSGSAFIFDESLPSVFDVVPAGRNNEALDDSYEEQPD